MTKSEGHLPPNIDDEDVLDQQQVIQDDDEEDSDDEEISFEDWYGPDDPEDSDYDPNQELNELEE